MHEVTAPLQPGEYTSPKGGLGKPLEASIAVDLRIHIADGLCSVQVKMVLCFILKCDPPNVTTTEKETNVTFVHFYFWLPIEETTNYINGDWQVSVISD